MYFLNVTKERENIQREEDETIESERRMCIPTE